MFSPSLFGVETTAHRKQHVQEIYSGTKSQLGYLQAPRRTCWTSPRQKPRYNPETRQETTSTTSKPQGASSMLNAIRRPTRRPEWKSITAFTSSRGTSKASRIKHEDPQFWPPGLIKPPHPPNRWPRQDSPSHNSWVLTHTLLYTIHGTR